MEKSYRIISIVFSVLGLIHIIVGFITFDGLSPDLMWFIGQGLMMIFLGFMNLQISFGEQPENQAKRLVVGANGISIIYFLVYLLVDINVIVPLVVLIVLSILNLKYHKKLMKQRH